MCHLLFWIFSKRTLALFEFFRILEVLDTFGVFWRSVFVRGGKDNNCLQNIVVFDILSSIIGNLKIGESLYERSCRIFC